MRRRVIALLFAVALAGCLAPAGQEGPEATIDPDDPPLRLVVDDPGNYSYEVVGPDGDTKAVTNGSLDLATPGDYTLRVVDGNETVAVHGFTVRRYELAGCNRDYLHVRGAAIEGRSHTEMGCADPADAVDRGRE